MNLENLLKIESNINILLEELDLAVLSEDDDKALEIGKSIDTLLQELNGNTIKLRIVQ